MEEKDIKKALDRSKKGIEEGWLWSEYDGEDVDVSKFPEPTQEELDEDEAFIVEYMKKAKAQQSKTHVKKEDGKSIFESALKDITDKK